MKPGDLIMFAWPSSWSEVDKPLNWETARIGLIINVTTKRPNDRCGDELSVLHEGERFSVPSAWCRPIKVSE